MVTEATRFPSNGSSCDYMYGFDDVPTAESDIGVLTFIMLVVCRAALLHATVRVEFEVIAGYYLFMSMRHAWCSYS